MDLKQTLITAATGIALLTNPSFGGGPVIVEDAYEAEPAPKLTPGEKIAIVAGILIIGGLLLGGGGDGPAACTCNDQPDDGGGSCGC